MAKYSFEFKKKVVTEYLLGKGGTHYLSKIHGISSTGNNTTLRKWVNAYRESGDKDLMRSRKNETYTFDFKLHVVELYLSEIRRKLSELFKRANRTIIRVAKSKQ